jgi:hypothetical protein
MIRADGWAFMNESLLGDAELLEFRPTHVCLAKG